MYVIMIIRVENITDEPQYTQRFMAINHPPPSQARLVCLLGFIYCISSDLEEGVLVTLFGHVEILSIIRITFIVI